MLALQIILCLLTGCLCDEHFENVALGKQCKQDSTHQTFVTCSMAVDGNTKGVYEKRPHTCIHTSPGSLNPWWEVDLDQKYPVYRLTLWARESYLHRMTGSVITVDGHHCYTISSQPVNREINITCASGVINGSVVRVSKQSSKSNGDNTLNLCEVQVWSCSRLLWGPRCENKCNCSDSGICDKFTGHCSGCSHLFWGPGCENKCNCSDGGMCDKDTGQCLENVALGKQCKQDSTHQTFVTCSMAVDGNTKGVYEKRPHTCIHTSPGSLNPWWEVDLGLKYPVYRLTLWARESYLQRMTGSVITVDGHHCFTISSQSVNREIHIHCDSGVINGSVVRVSKKSSKSNGDNTLNLCEVQVYSCSRLFWGPRCQNKCNCSDSGMCDKVTGHCPENVALGKRCKQDSTHQTFVTCSAAVDGNTKGVYENRPHTCIHTSPGSLNPWWEVDLDQKYPVYKITLWARESFLQRMTGSVITVDGHHCYTISSQPVNREINIHCDSGVINGSVVRVSKQSSKSNGDNVLNLCEVQVWICGHLFWGPRCENKCNCFNGSMCDKVTGHCPECDAGKHGVACMDDCGLGCNNKSCNQVTGHCECKPGWLPPLCRLVEECDAGKYGVACKEDCGLGCNNITCNKDTGHCECKPGWLPPLCRLENVALGRKCKQNSNHTVFSTCNKAVDGNTNDGVYENKPHTCMHTAVGRLNPWWEVDLGQPYPVHSITLWARKSFLYRMTGSVITVDGHHCYKISSQPANREININCTSGVKIGRVVRVSKLSSNKDADSTFINMCEVQVWSCSRLLWGPRCENKCNCSDGRVCDKVTGQCPVEECDAGKYGVACEEDCGLGCNTKACDKVTGNCKCKPGWLPPLCHLVNVALKKKCKLYLESSYNEYSCRKGVNGDTDSRKRNCIQTARIKSPSWEVDLGRPYPVYSITVWAKDGYKNRLKDLKITVDNSHCYTFTREPDSTSNEININCTSGVIKGRIVRLSFKKFTFGDRTFVLNFCEFQVWSCSQQFWGDQCEQKCGNCIDGHTCDKVTGHCPCKPGFKPPLCLD